jgi:hypothetical protein
LLLMGGCVLAAIRGTDELVRRRLGWAWTLWLTGWAAGCIGFVYAMGYPMTFLWPWR